MEHQSRFAVKPVFDGGKQRFHRSIRLVVEEEGSIHCQSRSDGRTQHSVIPLHPAFVQSWHLGVYVCHEIPVLGGSVGIHQRELQREEGGLRSWICLHHGFQDYAIGTASTAADGKEQLRMEAGVCHYYFAIGSHDCCLQEIVGPHAVRARKPAMATTGEPANYANSGICAADNNGAVFRHDFVDGKDLLSSGYSCRHLFACGVERARIRFEVVVKRDAPEVVRPYGQAAKSCASSREIVPGVLDVKSDIPFLSELQRSLYMCSLGRVHHVHRIPSQRASPITRIGILCNARAVGKNRGAAVIGPDRIIYADGILSVERRVRPLRGDISTRSWVVVGAGLIADGCGWHATDETTRERVIQG